LYHHGDASSFLTMTGMTRNAFTILHDVLFFGQQPQRTGRPQLMNPNAQLGLFLFFIGSTMGYKHLCLIFGCTPTVRSRVINKMLKLVVKKLKRHPLACVKFPNTEQLEYYAQLIHQREPAVDDVIGFMDGVLLSLWCKIQCIVGITVTQWLTICLPMVLMVESSFASSTFPEAGMMAQSWPMFCLIFIRKLAHTKCAPIKAFPEAVMLSMFLLDPLVVHKPIDLLLIGVLT
jgi:hypothetical protein